MSAVRRKWLRRPGIVSARDAGRRVAVLLLDVRAIRRVLGDVAHLRRSLRVSDVLINRRVHEPSHKSSSGLWGPREKMKKGLQRHQLWQKSCHKAQYNILWLYQALLWITFLKNIGNKLRYNSFMVPSHTFSRVIIYIIVFFVLIEIGVYYYVGRAQISSDLDYLTIVDGFPRWVDAKYGFKINFPPGSVYAYSDSGDTFGTLNAVGAYSPDGQTMGVIAIRPLRPGETFDTIHRRLQKNLQVQDAAVAGDRAMFLETDSTIKGEDQVQYFYIMIHNGYEYKIAVTGPVNKNQTARRFFDELASSFSYLR